MSAEFWWGIFLAVPLAIVANLASRPVMRRLDTFNERRAQKRSERDAAYAKRVATMDSASLLPVGVGALLRATWVTALFGVVSGVFNIFGNSLYAQDLVVGYWRINVGGGFTVVAISIALVGGLIVMNLVRDAVQVFTWVAAREDHTPSLSKAP